jgi:hypothetical protein
MFQKLAEYVSASSPAVPPLAKGMSAAVTAEFLNELKIPHVSIRKNIVDIVFVTT